MSMFTLSISWLTTLIYLDSWTWYFRSYAILLFIALDFTSITSHIHNWAFFSPWLYLFIVSGVTSPLISSSILGTYRPGEVIFQCPIFLPFHTVHRVLKARMLKWFAIPFSSGPCFVRTLHDQSWVAHWATCKQVGKYPTIWSVAQSICRNL